MYGIGTMQGAPSGITPVSVAAPLPTTDAAVGAVADAAETDPAAAATLVQLQKGLLTILADVWDEDTHTLAVAEPPDVNLTDFLDIAVGFVPLDLQTQRDAAWKEVPLGKKIAVVLVKGAGTDGDDPVLTIQQAQDASGTGVKALNFTTIWRKQGATVAAIPGFTTTTQEAANSYTNIDGHQQCVWVVEFDRGDLDVANGFSFIRATLNDVGTNAQLGAVLYLTR